MKLQRLKSIDIFRGLCMVWMILNHSIDWWVKPEYNWLQTVTIRIIDPIGVSGLLFISGVSIMISYRNRLNKVKVSNDYNYRMIKNHYLYRAFFFFIIALIYNIPTAIKFHDPSMIWTWFILLTYAISLFLAWPLLKIHKLFRVFIAILVLVLHQFIVSWLLPFQGNLNIFGLLYHILYSGHTQDPILVFFPFFLIGTVIGDIVYETVYLNNADKHTRNFENRLLIPTLTIGIFLIIFGILLKFPKFWDRESFSWIIYSIGIDLFLFTILLSFEVFEIIKTKKSYKLLFYYSYYSLTIYLAHNLLYFLFLHQLNLFNIWFFTAGAFILIVVIMRTIYKLSGGTASLKIQIGRLSYGVTIKFEEKLINKYIKTVSAISKKMDS